MKQLFFPAAIAAIILTGLPGAPALAQSLSDTLLELEPVVTSGSLSRPVSMVFLSENDLLVAEQHTGRVRRVIDGAVQTGDVLDLPVATSNEQGLLSILLHPEFESNSYVYVYYTHAVSDGAQDEEQRINRYTWDGSSLVSGTTILTLPSTPGNNHNGGVMVFGPPGEAPADQKLFVVIGDLNRNGQLQNFETGPAPDDTGCILRINDDGTTPSGAEKGPFHDVAGGNASLERLYAYGVRNSFGIGFDPLTDILWNTENGPGTFDEINLVSPGFNSGWEDYMGPVGNSSPPGLADFSGAGFYSEPEFSWEQTVAPTFIHFLNGDGLGSRYQYDCFVGDSKGGNLYHFEMNPGRTGYVLDPPLDDLVINTGEDNSQILFGQGFSSIVQISTGPDGNLYVLSLYGPPIHRISAKETGVSAPPWQLY